MSQPKVIISDGMPNPNDVTVQHGNKIVFENKDEESYTIAFVSTGQSISSDTFPILIPASGSATLNIKNDAPQQGFNYQISDSGGEVVWPVQSAGPGNKPPSVIVE